MELAQNVKPIVRRFVPMDDDILRAVCTYHFVKPTQAAKLVGRRVQEVQRRLRKLGPTRMARNGREEIGLGYVQSVRLERFGEDVWYPTQKGWDYGYEMGWIKNRIS